jgi:hypothetical protein
MAPLSGLTLGNAPIHPPMQSGHEMAHDKGWSPPHGACDLAFPFALDRAMPNLRLIATTLDEATIHLLANPTFFPQGKHSIGGSVVPAVTRRAVEHASPLADTKWTTWCRLPRC